jgi:hypothetical protein
MNLPKPCPKPERLPERKAVTIIAGFRCEDGVVICGDTQETSDIHKKNVTKVTVFPHDVEAKAVIAQADLIAAFCGAGNGPFIDMLIRKAWESTAPSVDLEQACDFIEQTIKDTYEEYGKIFQPGECPSVVLIYGVKKNGESRLFRSDGPVVNPVPECTSDGAGYFMADFLSSKMYDRRLTVYQCAILAAYILFQAKEHVEGCGGDSHIAVLRNMKPSGHVDSARVEAITEVLHKVDTALAEALIATADLSASQQTVDYHVGWLQNVINIYRQKAIEEIESSDSTKRYLMPELEPTERDELGFIKS